MCSHPPLSPLIDGGFLLQEEIPGIKTTKRTIKPGDPTKGVIQEGNTATVHATGVVLETKKKFWSTKDPGQQPFTYQAGVGGVIKGWDQGCLGMSVGEERELIIPAAEGYGEGGFPAWGIPPGGTLNFTLEVRAGSTADDWGGLGGVFCDRLLRVCGGQKRLLCSRIRPCLS